MSVHKKLMEARIQLQGKKLKKSGHNKFAGYDYFELGDFLPVVQEIFNGLGLCGVVRYTATDASLTVTDVESAGEIVITSPSAEVALKGCTPIQGIGAAQTYLRRYLWVTAMEIVEHDVLDATTGSIKSSATTGAWEAMSEESQQWLTNIAMETLSILDEGDAIAAVKHVQAQNLDNDEKAALTTRFNSKQRSAMTKALAEIKRAEA